MEASGTEHCGVVCGLIPLPSQSRVKKPVCCLPQKPLPGPDMKRLWQIFVLWVLWVFILWLMAPCVDQKPELEPHEKLTYLVPRCCSCLWFKFRKCGCPSGTLNYSLCNHTVREQSWFDAYYEKTMGFLMGATESMPRNAELSWMNQTPVHSFEMVGNQTTGHFICHRDAGAWGSWRQLLLLLLKLSGLSWTSDTLSEEAMVWEPRHS
ncbi:uncharacterized protein C20orf173 homolog isoform X1 [Pteropus alecto]|uniref:uncharacterized protein C20orf173 homolog isoform X1 n=1 Tax=Pteropus alecto TaxID=9402 RepID=UPI000D537F51|nr:uncharacterized protein C20orf173 homolog isoform X1 [Pteropus alecto]